MNRDVFPNSGGAKTPRLTIPQEAFDWYDEYAHGLIDRRTFLARLAGLALAGTSLHLLTSALMPNYAYAEQVSFNDENIRASYKTFQSPNGYGTGRGYWVQPAGLTTQVPAVLVVHENRGLNPYIEDVARRLANAGYIAFAPDALFTAGGYPGNDDEGREIQSRLDRTKIEQDFIAAAGFLKNHPSGTGKLGAVGFCFGGYIVNMLVATAPNLIDAAVPFYGTPAAPELLTHIKAPLLIHLAELDSRVNATWPAYEQALKANHNRFQMHRYAGVNHGFHNDSTARYNEQAASLAWARTLAFFEQNLGR